MQLGLQALTLALLASFAVLPCAAGAGARLRRQSVALLREEPEEDPTKGIKEKWDKMDDFLEAMFTIACKWKHGKDVHGLAAEKIKQGKLEAGPDFDAFVAKTQARNVQALTDSCGEIVAKGKGKCRQGCADRYGKAMNKRASCDEGCVSAYTNFEKSCNQKAQHLEQVYAVKMKAAAGRETCYEGHCAEFPNVWLKDEASKMKTAVDESCEPRCTEDMVELGCRRKWTLEVDFKRNEIVSSCHGETKVRDCFDEKKTTISSDEEKCASGGKTTCGTQYDDCTAKGNTDKASAEAKAFCDSRKKMCTDQVTKKCLADHKTALDKAQDVCETTAGEDLATCEAEKLTKKEEETVTACVTERQPTCDKDCHKKCDVDKLTGCLDNLKSDYDPAADFCTDFWHLLHESSEVDPVSGMPIVLLQK